VQYSIIEFAEAHYRITELNEVHYRNIEFTGVRYRIIELTRVHYRIRQDVTFPNTVDKQSSGLRRPVECEKFTDISE
jgi:hypothetical protein